MRNNNTAFARVAVFFLTLFLFSNSAYSEDGFGTRKVNASLDTTAASARIIDVNNISMYVLNNGCFAQPPNSSMGFYYPGSNPPIYHKSIIFASGLWLGALVDDSVRVMLNQFAPESSPGAVDEQGNLFGRYDPAYRVYKIGKADSLQNTEDWNNWPADQGAPIDGSGQPLVRGDQTLWCSFTDAFPFATGSKGLYDRITRPLGAEIKMTTWGYKDLDDVIFLEWKIINKSGKEWVDTYVGLWADCEIGAAHSDRTGSDSTLLMVYDYEGSESDKNYGFAPPALGYMLLRPPVIPSAGSTAFAGRFKLEDYEAAQCHAPVFYKRGYHEGFEGWGADAIVDPQFAYQMLQGRNKFNDPMINTVTGLKTNWQFTGDPASQTGWLDPTVEDKRFLISSGPFTLATGDTQTVTAAIVVGAGNDHLQNVTALKYKAAMARGLYFADGLLFSDKIFADLSGGAFTINLNLANLESRLTSLEFDISGLPAGVTLTGIQPSNAIISTKCLLTQTSDTTWHVSLETSSPVTGQNTILKIAGSADGQFSGDFQLLLSSIQAEDGGKPVYITSLPLEVNVTRRPGDFHLIQPESNIELSNLIQTFTWTKPDNPENKPLEYRFYITSLSQPCTTVTDTCITLNIASFPGFRKLPEEFNWTVSVFDGITEKAAADTFTISIPPYSDWDNLYNFATVNVPAPIKNKWPSRLNKDKDNLYLCTETGSSKLDDTGQIIRSRSANISRFHLYKNQGWSFADSLSFEYVDSQSYHSYSMYGDIIMEASYLDQYSQRQKINFYRYKNNDFNPEPLSTIEPSHPSRYKYFTGNFLYLYSNKWIMKYDVSNLKNPVFIAESSLDFPQLGYISHQLLRGNTLISALSNSIFAMSSIDADLNVTLGDTLHLPGYISSISRNGNIAAIMLEKGTNYSVVANQLLLIDISKPNDLQVLSSLPMPGGGQIIMEDETLYIKSLDIYAVDISKPGKPEIIGFVHDRYLQFPYTAEKGWLFYGDKDKNLQISYLENVVGPEKIIEMYPPVNLIQNYPNPFLQKTKVKFFSNQRQKIIIEIFNILGRKINTILDSEIDTGYHIVEWNGKTDNGQNCASGLYICRIKTARKNKSMKMVKLN